MKALELYLTAEKIMKGDYGKNKSQLYNVAHCLTMLGYNTKSVQFLEAGRKLYKEDDDILTFHIDNWLAKNYMDLGQFKRAKNLLNKCHEKAVLNSDDRSAMGIVLHNIGVVHQLIGDCNAGIGYLDKSLEFCEEGSQLYFETIYRKARCYFDLKYYVACDNLVVLGKKQAKGSEIFTLLFESLRFCMSPNDLASDKYVREAIEYLLKSYRHLDALFLSEFFRKYYEGKSLRFEKRGLRMSDFTRKVYAKMLERGDFE